MSPDAAAIPSLVVPGNHEYFQRDGSRGLSEYTNRWTVVFFHHPTYSTAVGRDNPDVRQRWRPLLEEYEVDLVLSGPDHTDGRGYTKASRRCRIQTGPMYVNSVSGPKMYEVSGQNPGSRAGTA